MGAFYNYCKINTRLISHLFYRNVLVNGAENIPLDRPVLLLPNHPCSFLDPVLIGAAIKRPTYFLARGDAFNNNFANIFLYSLNMLPVFRISEGKENLGKNNQTFDACQSFLEKREIVLLFPEGLSLNNWDLRVFKKGPPRISKKAWSSESPSKDMVVVPIGLTYEHFNGCGKTILLNIGKPMYKEEFDIEHSEAIFVKKFNERLESELRKLAYVNPQLIEGTVAHENFRANIQQLAKKESNINHIVTELLKGEKAAKKASNASFMAASLLFYPLYRFGYWLAKKIIKQSSHYDSIYFGLFLFLWPVYLLLLGGLISLFF